MRRRDVTTAKDASELNVGIAVSEFNREVSEGLLSGALAALEAAGVGDVAVVRVAGAFELPLVAERLAAAGHDAVIALGAVIKGETDHYEYIAGEASRGLMDAGLSTGVPVAFGVLTVRDAGHALDRSRPGRSNKGAEAADAAVAAALAIDAIARTPVAPPQ